MATSLPWVARQPRRSAAGWKRTPKTGSGKESYGHHCLVEKMEPDLSEMLGERREPEDTRGEMEALFPDAWWEVTDVPS